MTLRFGRGLGLGIVLLAGSVFAQNALPASEASSVARTPGDNASAPAAGQSAKEVQPTTPTPAKPKLGPLDISINWRERAEGWNWFEGKTGNSDYGFWDSTLRLGVGQTLERVDWFLEGEQPSILGLPNNAVVAAPQGQLGLGGTYYAANNNHTNVANGFVKQAFVNFKRLGPAGLKLGRFEYFDGLEVTPKDPLLATVIQTRISSRLISNFAFAAVQRTFDGVQLSANSGAEQFHFLRRAAHAGSLSSQRNGRAGRRHLLRRLHPVGEYSAKRRRIARIRDGLHRSPHADSENR